MDRAERERFHQLAERLFSAVGEMTVDLREEVGRMGVARSEVEARLKSGVESARAAESKSAAERALAAEELACDRVAALVGEALRRVERIREASAGLYPSAPDPAAARKEMEERLAQLRAEGFSLDVAKFFYGVLLILLIGAIARFIDMCEAFLGHEVGSREARRRLSASLKQLLGAGADLAIGAFCAPAAIPIAFAESLVEAVRQIRATPEREAGRWEELIAKGNDQRAILILTSKRIAEEEVPLVSGYVDVCLDAVETDRARIGSSGGG